MNIKYYFRKKYISTIIETERERYIFFFRNSYKDNFKHAQFTRRTFPRWSIISGYYAMHDITKLLLAQQFNIKVDFKVHNTTITLMSLLVKDNWLQRQIKQGYKEFLTLANDLEEAHAQRTKTQYYTGSSFSKEQATKKAEQFLNEIVILYLKKVSQLLKSHDNTTN